MIYKSRGRTLRSPIYPSLRAWDLPGGDRVHHLPGTAGDVLRGPWPAAWMSPPLLGADLKARCGPVCPYTTGIPHDQAPRTRACSITTSDHCVTLDSKEGVTYSKQRGYREWSQIAG